MTVTDLSYRLAGNTAVGMTSLMTAIRDTRSITALLSCETFVSHGIAAYHNGRGTFLTLLVGDEAYRTDYDTSSDNRLQKKVTYPDLEDVFSRNGSTPAQRLSNLYENNFSTWLYSPGGRGTANESMRWAFMGSIVLEHPFISSFKRSSVEDMDDHFVQQGVKLNEWFRAEINKAETYYPVVDYRKGISLTAMLNDSPSLRSNPGS
jgi:hypothetical protein